MAETTSFLDAYSGVGLDDITSSAVSTAYLTMVQPGSTAESNGHEVGTWVNSATGENYGNTVTVVPMAFKILWCERDSSGMTVGRYEPNSIQVELKPAAPGKRGYPQMTNPLTGNTVTELFVYAVTLPEHPEAGTLLLNPSVMSMRACKSWNSQLRSQLLPNGTPAPIFAYSWALALGMVPNPRKPNGQLTAMVSVAKGSLIDEAQFTRVVKPQLADVGHKVLAISAPAEGAEDME